MSFQSRLALIVLLASAGLSFAQKEAKPDPAKSRDVEARMADGSVVRMAIEQESLKVVTRYGKLTVATNEIIRIDLGMRMPEGVPAKIGKAIQQLGSAEFKEREAASEDLLSYGALAYQALQRATKSTDPEVAQRATALVKRIAEKVPAEKLRIKDYDVIKTIAFTMVGRIEDSKLKGTTSYFGDVQLSLADVLSMRSLARATGTEVTLDGAKYCVQGGQAWLDTGVEVEADNELTMTASGQVNVGPNVLGPGQGMSGPAGMPNLGVGNGTGLPIGALIGRIGEQGAPVFLVGERYTGTPRTTGKLYLRIVEGPWGVNGVGSYTVKINENVTSPVPQAAPPPGAPTPAPGPPGAPPPPPMALPPPPF